MQTDKGKYFGFPMLLKNSNDAMRDATHHSNIDCP